MNERIDWCMRQRVDEAVEIKHRQGVHAAAQYMYAYGVPTHVARRLLSKLAL